MGLNSPSSKGGRADRVKRQTRSRPWLRARRGPGPCSAHSAGSSQHLPTDRNNQKVNRASAHHKTHHITGQINQDNRSPGEPLLGRQRAEMSLFCTEEPICPPATWSCVRVTDQHGKSCPGLKAGVPGPAPHPMTGPPLPRLLISFFKDK